MSNYYERVSIRKYQDKEVEPEKILEMLRAAMQAPSAANQQPWEFYIVNDKNKLAELAAVGPNWACVGGAPVCIVPVYRKECRLPQFAQIDMSIALENMWLACQDQGLGGVWLGMAPNQERMDAVRKILNIPEGLEPFALFACGYPAEEKKQEDRYDASRIHFIGNWL